MKIREQLIVAVVGGVIVTIIGMFLKSAFDMPNNEMPNIGNINVVTSGIGNATNATQININNTTTNVTTTNEHIAVAKNNIVTGEQYSTPAKKIHLIKAKSSKQSTSNVGSLVGSISFDAFLRQMKTISLDSHKIDYLESNKKLLKKDITFTELNRVLDQLAIDTYRIDAVRTLRNILSRPTETELDVYLSKFSIDTYKKEALDLVYQ